MIRVATVLILIAAMAGCAGSGNSSPGSESGGTTLGNSNVSFRDALSACSGALGSITFAAGHARIAAHAGVETDEVLPDANGIISVVLENESGTKSANVHVDQTKRTVSAKNVRSQKSGNVICIYPD